MGFHGEDRSAQRLRRFLHCDVLKLHMLPQNACGPAIYWNVILGRFSEQAAGECPGHVAELAIHEPVWALTRYPTGVANAFTLLLTPRLRRRGRCDPSCIISTFQTKIGCMSIKLQYVSPDRSPHGSGATTTPQSSPITWLETTLELKRPSWNLDGAAREASSGLAGSSTSARPRSWNARSEPKRTRGQI